MTRKRKGIRLRPRGGLPMSKEERRKIYTDKECKGRPDQMECYKRRDATLSELGYASYALYLASDQWKYLREKKLRQHRWCIICDKPPTQVHHLSYAPDVLLGLKQCLLVTMCGNCHLAVEFNGNVKRTLEEANEFLLKAAEAAGKINWVRMIKSVIKHYKTKKGKMR